MSSPKEQLDDNGGWQRKPKRRKWAKRQHSKWIRREWKQRWIVINQKQFEGWAT